MSFGGGDVPTALLLLLIVELVVGADPMQEALERVGWHRIWLLHIHLQCGGGFQVQVEGCRLQVAGVKFLVLGVGFGLLGSRVWRTDDNGRDHC